MDKFIKEMIDKGLVSIVKKALDKREIADYTKPFKADNYTDWMREYRRN